MYICWGYNCTGHQHECRLGGYGMKKRLLTATLILLAIPIVIWSLSLIRCEVMTQKYYDDFSQAYTQNPMLDEMEYFKVLRCDGNSADVYYVSKDMTAANVLTFENHQGTWSEVSWRTVWSTSGSASEVIYPYWWHFIYGGF